MPFWQRPNVRNALVYMSATVAVGYVISRTAVINEHERSDVEKSMPPSDHSKSVLYTTIRESEARRLAKQ